MEVILIRLQITPHFIIHLKINDLLLFIFKHSEPNVI